MAKITCEWSENAYEGEVPARWNGWAVPRVDEPTARQILDDLAKATAEDERPFVVTWHGADVAVFSAYADGSDAQRDYILRDGDGLYTIDLGLCFFTEDEA